MADDSTPYANRPIDATDVRVPDPTATTDATTVRSVGGPESAGDLPDIPGYAVEGEIARGGMGRVLAARDLALDRSVAVKILLPGASAADAARRFVIESKVTARLQHPNVPPVHALGELPDGSPFLAMKLIEGRTLAAHLKDRAAPAAELPRFLQVFEQVSQAVGYAHSRGIIHRDIKPANVMVGAFGEVQVMDWGLARSGEEDDVSEGPVGRSPAADPASLTQTGDILGTPAYMAPEQARGERVGERADVFALGGVLCEILTGERPFAGGSSVEVVRKAAAGDVADAHARLARCGADAGLVALATRCLAPAAADRPADGVAVAAALADYRAGVEDRLQAAVADRAAAEAEAREQRKRRKVQLALAAAVFALAALVGVGGWYVQRQTAARERAELLDREAVARKEAEQARLAAEERERQARDLAVVGQVVHESVEQAYRDLNGGHWQDARTSLARAADRLAVGDWPDALRAQVAAARADLDMALRLDAARMRRSRFAAGANEFDSDGSTRAYEAAFAGYGIPVGSLPAADAAARIRASRIAPLLVSALDGWEFYHLDAAAAAPLLAALRACGPDSWRERVRVWANNGPFGDLAPIAAGVEVLSPDHAVMAYNVVFARGRPDVATAALRHAQARHPTDFWLNLSLGESLSFLETRTDADLAEAVGFLRVAVAVRPQSGAGYQALGLAHEFQKDSAAAVRAYRRVTELAPDHDTAFFALGNILRQRGELAEAEPALRRAIALDPKKVLPYMMLSNLLETKGELAGAVASIEEALRLEPGNPHGAEALVRLRWRIDHTAPPPREVKRP